MAFCSASRPVRGPLLSQLLRPSLCSSKSAVTPALRSRAFHATPHPHFLEACVNGAEGLITGLHTITGLPWFTTIPLTALIIRTTISGPLITYVHHINARRRRLAPMLLAWIATFKREIGNSPDKGGSPEEAQRRLMKRWKLKSLEIYKRHGAQKWKLSLNWLQLPIFLTAIEGIRKICGLEKGLMGLLIHRSSAVEDGTFYQNSLQQSLATEGALWFPNLLLPDPYCILPFVLSGALFSSVYFHTQKYRSQSAHPSKWQLRFNGFLMVLALAMGPMTLQLPSAMHLYWISSLALGFTHSIWLERYRPLPANYGPPKRK